MPKVLHTDEAFKKTEAVIGRPGVTDNANDEYFRHPPHNVNPDMSDRRSGGLKEGNPKEPLEPGAPPDAELGRVKKDTELAEMAQEDSVHS